MLSVFRPLPQSGAGYLEMCTGCFCACVVGLLVGALNRVFADHEMAPIASSAVVAGMESIILA